MAKNNKEFVKEITPQSEDFSQWYTDVIKKADLIDYAPVRGCMVLKPDGYELWEAVQTGLNRRFKETGHRNAYFPLFIPESFLNKEKEHVEGFNPETPWVTHIGEVKLQERLAIRPTSETIIGEMYHRWIKSYRDLPVLLNQWANVVRWEKATRPFLRTTEFLWQEGHTAHQTEEEAREEVLKMLDVYRDFVETDLAIPIIPGKKSDMEKFKGAVDTYSIEALMQDGKALQAGTSHYLGQKFAKVFDIQFLDEDNQLKYVYQTSWGMSTRIIGAMIMVHGDDRGLVLPPKAAPTQVVIVPIMAGKDKEMVKEKAQELQTKLKNSLRIHLDDREEYTPGWKFNEWEMRGIPIRIEIGPRDIQNNQVVLVRRDTGEKIFTSLDGLQETIEGLLEEIQENLYRKAKNFLTDNTHQAENMEQLKEAVVERKGMALSGWCGTSECETAVKEETGATIRNIPLEQPEDSGTCVYCSKEAKHKVYFAKAY